MIKAVDEKKNGFLNVEELTALFHNIGAAETVTQQDIKNIISELGDGSNSTISVKKMIQIM